MKNNSIEHVIRAYINEQQNPFGTIGPASPQPARSKTSFNAAAIAKEIYDSKGYVSDDEERLYTAMERIKNISQYRDVTKELQRLTGGRGIGEYLRSFLSLNERLNAVAPLLNKIGKSDWNWTIKRIIPWNDFKNLNWAPNLKKLTGDVQTAAASNAATFFIQNVYPTEWSKWKGAFTWTDEDTHTFLQTASVIMAFIPVAGPIASAALGLADAYKYWNEGDPESAGMMATLSLVPGLGAAGRKLLPKLVTKLRTGSKTFTAAEQKILKSANQNKDAIRTKFNKTIQSGVNSGKISPNTLKTLKVLKPVGNGAYTVGKWGTQLVLPAAATFTASSLFVEPGMRKLYNSLHGGTFTQANYKSAEAQIANSMNQQLKRELANLQKKESVNTGSDNLISEQSGNYWKAAEDDYTPKSDGSTSWVFYIVAAILGYTAFKSFKLAKSIRNKVRNKFSKSATGSISRQQGAELIAATTALSRNLQEAAKNAVKSGTSADAAFLDAKLQYKTEGLEDIWNQLDQRTFKELLEALEADYKKSGRSVKFKTTKPTTTGTGLKLKIGSTNVDLATFPNLTPEQKKLIIQQFNAGELSIHQRIGLTRNSKMTWKDFQELR
jgi:hypothetical protein